MAWKIIQIHGLSAIENGQNTAVDRDKRRKIGPLR
jgi:hypothetical protein